MDLVEHLLSSEYLYYFGWMLLHSLWLMLLPAAGLAIAFLMVPKRLSQVRYLLSISALVLMVGLFGAAATLVPPRESRGRVVLSMTSQDTLPEIRSGLAAVAVPAADEPSGVMIAEKLSPQSPVAGPGSPDLPVPKAALTSESQGSRGQAEGGGSEQLVKVRGWYDRSAHLLSPLVSWVVPGWLIGVILMAIWHVGGLVAVQRLRSMTTRPAPRKAAQCMNALIKQMGINKAVVLLESAVIQSPAVIGWFKPVILLPASAFTGFTPEQLETILAHELAHIRRHDYLINLIQTLVVTLLFYHPAVWWVSRHIRNERECCCDAIVIKLIDRKLDYATALTQIASFRASPYRLALAAGSGSIVDRVRRIAGLDDAPSISPKAWLTGVLLLALAVTLPMTLLASQASGLPKLVVSAELEAVEVDKARVAEALTPELIEGTWQSTWSDQSVAYTLRVISNAAKDPLQFYLTRSAEGRVEQKSASVRMTIDRDGKHALLRLSYLEPTSDPLAKLELSDDGKALVFTMLDKGEQVGFGPVGKKLLTRVAPGDGAPRGKAGAEGELLVEKTDGPAEAVEPEADHLGKQESAFQPSDFLIAPASFDPPDTKPETLAHRVPGHERPVYRTAEPFVTLNDIAHAELVEVASAGGVVFDLQLKPAAAKRLETYTREHIGEPMLISIKGDPVSAPIVHGELSKRIQVTGVTAENRAAYELVVSALRRVASDRERITGTWITSHNNEEEGPHYTLLELNAEGQWTTAYVWGTPQKPTAVKVIDRRVGWDLHLTSPMFAFGSSQYHADEPVYGLDLRLDAESSLGGKATYFVDDDTFMTAGFNTILIETLSRRVNAKSHSKLLASLSDAVAEYEARQEKMREQGEGGQSNAETVTTIDQLSSYADGGTLGIAYTPPGGERVEVAIDSRSIEADSGDNTHLRLYTGAMRPDHDAAILVEEDSDLERQVFGELRGWVDSHFTADEIDAILNVRKIDDLSEQEMWALRITRKLEAVGRYRQRQKFAIFPASYDKDGDGRRVAIATPETRRSVYYTKQTEMLTIDDIADASLVAAERGDPLLQIVLKPEGAKRLEEHTRAHQADALLIMIDGKPACAPIICGVMRGQFRVLSVADDAQERFRLLIDHVRDRRQRQEALSIKAGTPENAEPAAISVSARAHQGSFPNQPIGEQSLEPATLALRRPAS